MANYNGSSSSGKSNTNAIAVDLQSGNIRSDDTAFDAGELSEFGSLKSIFTVISDTPTESEIKLMTDNGIWGQGRLYKESKENLVKYKKDLLERYIDIPRPLWRLVNDQIGFIYRIENKDLSK
jgi:hypothetical protein